MSFAVSEGVRFNAGGGTRVPGSGRFTGLDEADGQILMAWAAGAGARGIDAVLDLSPRPWNIAGVRSVFGVFQCGHDMATWLIMRSGPVWMLARWPDGFVSDVSELLPDILALIDADIDA